MTSLVVASVGALAKPPRRHRGRSVGTALLPNYIACAVRGSSVESMTIKGAASPIKSFKLPFGFSSRDGTRTPQAERIHLSGSEMAKRAA